MSTEVHINIERTMFDSTRDEFAAKVAERPEEIKDRQETGFEYICDFGTHKIFRKRKY